MDPETFSNHPNYDYLADIQEILLQMDGNLVAFPVDLLLFIRFIPLFSFKNWQLIFLESSASEMLILLGEELITTCCTGIVERAFRSLGVDFQEFLGALDGVHDVLKLQDESVNDTDFICADEGELIFTTERPVIAWILLGSLKALTRILYDVDASIVIEPIENDSKCYRYLFTLHDDESIQPKVKETPSPVVSKTADLKMNPQTFCKAFPWHFIMNDDLELIQMGKGFSKLFKSSLATHGRLATTYFHFKRPTGLTIKFREIIRRSNTPFMLALKPVEGTRHYASEVRKLRLKNLRNEYLKFSFYWCCAGSGYQRAHGILS